MAKREKQSHSLRPGWAQCTVGDLASYVNGRAFKPSEWKDVGRPIIRIQNLNDPAAPFNYSPEAHEDKYRIQRGDLLFAWSASLGAYIWDGEEAWLNQHIFRVDLYDGVEKRYVYYLLDKITAELYAKAHGSGMVHVTKGKFEETSVDLPPTAEQIRIVSKIDQLISELDQGIASLQTARDQLNVYRQAVLENATSGDLLVQRGHRESPFGDDKVTSLKKVVDELGQGWSPRCKNHPSPDNGVWGVIKTTAIQHQFFDESENKELPGQLEPRPHLSIKAGDILITRAGPRKRVGVACLVRACRPRLMLCDKAYRLQARIDRILPEYLEMLLNSPRVLEQIEELKTGISDSGVNLTQARFLSLQIPVPSIADQSATLEELESILSNIENAKMQIEDALARASALRQSILKRAFAGHLVEQDSNDEPASELLARIKAKKEEREKAKMAAKKKVKKKAKRKGAA